MYNSVKFTTHRQVSAPLEYSTHFVARPAGQYPRPVTFQHGLHSKVKFLICKQYFSAHPGKHSPYSWALSFQPISKPFKTLKNLLQGAISLWGIVPAGL